MNIWIVSLFEPTPLDKTRPMRFMSVANAAIQHGYKLTHFACTFRHSTKVQRFKGNHVEKINPKHEIHYVYGPVYKKNISYSRLKSHQVFTKNLMNHIKTLERPDVVLIAFPPISTAFKLGNWCKLNQIPYVIDIIDPWPDVFERFIPKAFKGVSKIALKPYRKKVKQIMEKASGVSSISKAYTEWALSVGFEKSKPREFFYPSVPIDEIHQKLNKIEASPSGKLTLIYAGNFGVAYDIPIILEVAKQFDKDFPGQTEFVFCGAGHYQEQIAKQSEQTNNLTFLGRLGYDDLMKAYKNADLGLAQYAKGATQTVTYKLFDYLAAGLPVLNSLPTEMAEIIEEYEVGANNLPDEPQKLFENIKLYFENKDLLEDHKKRAIETTKAIGDNKTVYTKFINFLEKTTHN